MTWQTGRDTIEKLITTGEIGRVTPDEKVAQRLLDDATHHLATATAALTTEDLSGAYQLAYDCLRKSAAALLAVQGLRATSRGGHIAVQDASVAQFGSTLTALRSFGRVRRGRNQFEYPDSDTSGPSPDDVNDALDVAGRTLEASVKILTQGILRPW